MGLLAIKKSSYQLKTYLRKKIQISNTFVTAADQIFSHQNNSWRMPVTIIANTLQQTIQVMGKVVAVNVLDLKNRAS